MTGTRSTARATHHSLASTGSGAAAHAGDPSPGSIDSIDLEPRKARHHPHGTEGARGFLASK